MPISPLNAELNLICHLLALVGAHHILHVSRARVKLTFVRVSACIGVQKMLTVNKHTLKPVQN